MTGSLNTVVQRTRSIIDNDSAINKVVRGFRSLKKLAKDRSPIWLNTIPRREIKDAVQTGSSAKGRELWRVRVDIQCGIHLYGQPTDQHPTEAMPDIIGVSGAVWDALQGSFLPDTGGTSLLTVPMRLLEVNYDPDFFPTEDGGLLWVGTALYEGALWVTNPT